MQGPASHLSDKKARFPPPSHDRPRLAENSAFQSWTLVRLIQIFLLVWHGRTTADQAQRSLALDSRSTLLLDCLSSAMWASVEGWEVSGGSHLATTLSYVVPSVVRRSKASRPMSKASVVSICILLRRKHSEDVLIAPPARLLRTLLANTERSLRKSSAASVHVLVKRKKEEAGGRKARVSVVSRSRD